MSKRHNPEFEAFLRKHVTLDAQTGLVKVKDAYASLGFNIMWNSTTIPVPYAHLVWFLAYDKWPRNGYHVDHINDNSLDNRLTNLQEITETENQKKRRGRIVYRNYGSGKYGYGLYIFNDKRDGRFYVSRTMSRGHGKGDLKGITLSLGGFDTLTEAEAKVEKTILEIKINGLDYLPPRVTRNQKKATVALDAVSEKLRVIFV